METDVIGIYGDILSGRRGQFPKKFWHTEQAKQYASSIVRHLFNDVIGLEAGQKPGTPLKELFRDYKLQGMIKDVFDWSFFSAVDNAFPGRYKPSDFCHIKWIADSRVYGKDTQPAREATLELIHILTDQEGEYKWGFEEIPEKIETKHFKAHGLGSMGFGTGFLCPNQYTLILCLRLN